MTFSIALVVIFNSIMQDLQKEFLPCNDGDIPHTTKTGDYCPLTPDSLINNSRVVTKEVPAIDLDKFAEKYNLSADEMTELKQISGISGFGGFGLARGIVFFVSAWNLWDKHKLAHKIELVGATQKEFAIYRVLYMRNR